MSTMGRLILSNLKPHQYSQNLVKTKMIETVRLEELQLTQRLYRIQQVINK